LTLSNAASKKAFAIAAFISSGRSELYAYIDGPMIGADLWIIRKSSFFIGDPSAFFSMPL